MAEPTVPAPEGQTGATREATRAEERYVTPPVDIYEDDQGLVVVADLPGVATDALDVGVERGILTIEARAAHMAPGDQVYREYDLTGYFRQFQLPVEVDSGRITAELTHGVLRLRLPRAERAQPRRIPINAS